MLPNTKNGYTVGRVYNLYLLGFSETNTVVSHIELGIITANEYVS